MKQMQNDEHALLQKALNNLNAIENLLEYGGLRVSGNGVPQSDGKNIVLRHLNLARKFIHMILLAEVEENADENTN